LVARGSPVVGYALRQRICGKLLHFCQCLAGAELRGCRPEDGCGRVEIVAGDQLRAFLTLYIQQGTQWDHTSRLVADIEALDVPGIQPVIAFSLDIDLEYLVEFVEKIYK